MTTYQVHKSCSDYRGEGNAWAAIVDGQVVALRYMSDYAADSVPQWIEAVKRNATGLDSRCLPVCRGSKTLAKMASAAYACDDCPTPPRRERYRPSELLAMAREVLARSDDEAFAAHRKKCRDELEQLGEVKSGMASCWEFVSR